MLGGLLGGGFSVKCKSLVKATRARIEVVRRRAEAKQRFLKEDLAKLLSNGLDINAYGRTEEFVAGMNLLSSYDFIEQSCEYIVKQLSRMQKQGECPEECREAVASLMFAAARFSDLPELRDLRDIFQQRYGNCLEVFVNQKFVEKLSSRPPATEKRLQVLQGVASEFSIKWDSRGFERRMSTPVIAQVDVQKADIVKQRLGLVNEKNRIGDFLKRDESDNPISGKKKETMEHREKSLLKRGESSSRGNNSDISFRGRTENKHLYPVEKVDTKLKVERSSSSSANGKMLDNVHSGDTRPGNVFANHPRKGEIPEALFREKAESAPSCGVEHLRKAENVISYNYPNLNSTRKGPDEESDRLRSCSNYALPPPYVKPKDNIAPPSYIKPKEDKYRDLRGSKHAVSDRDGHSVDPDRSNVVESKDNIAPPSYIKPKEDKYRDSRGSKHAVSDLDGHFVDSDRINVVKSKDNIARPPYIKPIEDFCRDGRGSRHAGPNLDGHSTDPDSRDRSNVVNSSDRHRNEQDHHRDHEEQFLATAKVKNYGHEEELNYQDMKIPLPKPRSIRRKHHKSSSSYNNVAEDGGGGVNRSSSSTRRKDHSRNGLRILFDDEEHHHHHRKDDEERIIDKLLIHYSKKPSSYDDDDDAGGNLRRKLPPGESSHDRTRSEEARGDGPTRSVSLPHDQTTSPELKKVIARSNTFQPDNQARHVHPKLPDYDELAARFSALKGR